MKKINEGVYLLKPCLFEKPGFRYMPNEKKRRLSKTGRGGGSNEGTSENLLLIKPES